VGPNHRPMPRRGGTLPMAARGADRYFELKSEIHRKLIGVLNLERVSSIPNDRLRAGIGRVVERLLDEERVPMTTAERTRIVEEVLDEVLGLGQEIFAFERTGVSDAGKVEGRFRATGVQPRILDRLRVSGILLPPAIFEETVGVNL
jgi:hypothetical protein